MAHPLLKKYLATGLILAFIVLLYWYSVSLQAIFGTLTEVLRTYEQRYAFLAEAIFILLAALSAMLSPFSSAPLVPFAVILWGDALTITLLYFGWLIGGTITYKLGKEIGYRILKQYVDIDGELEEYHRKFNTRTEFGLVLLFRLAMPAEIPGYVLGTIRYHFWKYMAATAIAELPFAIFTVYAGEAVVQRDAVLLAATGAMIVISLSGAFYFFRQKIKNNNI